MCEVCASANRYAINMAISISMPHHQHHHHLFKMIKVIKKSVRPGCVCGGSVLASRAGDVVVVEVVGNR